VKNVVTGVQEKYIFTWAYCLDIQNCNPFNTAANHIEPIPPVGGWDWNREQDAQIFMLR